MTDEEKAEEYVDKLLCNEKCSFLIGKEKIKKYILKVYIDSLKCCKKSYDKGLAEGRKEKCLEQNNDGTIRPCEVMKENEELKAQISILLSCKECPENKGGYICAKEYNDKCLSQKIQHIKELKEENELMGQIIQDLLKKSDGCYVCEAKGQKGYLCECKNEPECVNHIIELYRSSK